MADQYTDRNGLTKQEIGAHENTWGNILNDEVIELIDEALDGVVVVDVSAANVTLTATDAVSNQARNRVLRIVGSPGTARTITIPDVEKVYFLDIRVSGTNSVTIKNISDATGVTVSSGSDNQVVVCDGTSTTPLITPQSGVLIASNNLSDLTDVSAARDNLGLSILAEVSVSGANRLVGTNTSADPVMISATQGITVSNGTIKADLATTVSAGIIRIATTAEAQAGTVTDAALTPASLVGGQSLTANGYVIHPGGRIEQWGVNTPTIRTENSINTVTFPTPFTTACYTVQVAWQSPTNMGGDSTFGLKLHNTPGTSTFTYSFDLVSGPVPNDGVVYWYAIGK